MSRYNNSRTKKMVDELYESFLDKRGMKTPTHYTTQQLNHPTVSQRASLERIEHIWVTGDTMMKLAHQHYGEVELWWVIAWYNTRPTDAHYNLGDVVYIPHPISRVMSILRSE